MSSQHQLEPKKERPRGLIKAPAGKGVFDHQRYLPSDRVSAFVEHYWVVQWDLCGEAQHRQSLLPHPSVHVVVEGDRCEVVGVVERSFTRTLEDKGRVFGIKFQPGGFHSFLGSSVSALTNRNVPITDVFGNAGSAYGTRVTREASVARCITHAEELLLSKCPVLDEQAHIVRRIVEETRDNPTITRVEELVERFAIGTRTLQRLFKQYVGVGPKWVILRYRLHEALERIERGETEDWAGFALDLGYYDQAHFIRHFKEFVGQTPEDYAHNLPRLKDEDD